MASSNHAQGGDGMTAPYVFKQGDELEDAWQRAFRAGRFIEAEAGRVMYMYSDANGVDFFKDKDTRRYL